MSCEARPGWVPGQTPKGNKAGEPVDAEKRPELIEQMEALGREIEFLAARLSVLGGRLEEVMRPAPPTEEGEKDLEPTPCSPAAQHLRSLRFGVISIRQCAESLIYRLEV